MDDKRQIEPEEGYLDVAAGLIHYLEWGGDGARAHFLHGNGFCAGTYAPFIRHLVDDLNVVASDVRGHGGSDDPPVAQIRHWDIFAEDLKALIERRLAPPVIGMGHSLGAVTTAICAARHPELFSALVLIDPVFLSPQRLRRLTLLRWLGLDGVLPLVRGARRRRRRFQTKTEALNRFTSGRGIFKTWSPEFVHAYLECGLLVKDPQTAVLTCDPELEAQIFASIPADVWDYVSRLKGPVLAIRGGKSDVFTAEAEQHLTNLMPASEVVLMPGCGHFPPMEKPAETAAAILDFAGRHVRC
jgi:pimeloyl-ACP methyl ester carboxylesterase